MDLLGGREGVGKTICAYTIGASITRGTLPGIYFGTPRGVIVAATEDSWEHTIVPRLMAAGADLERVYRVDVITAEGTETNLSLPGDLVALERVVRDVGAALIVLDPLLSRVDTALDTHKDAEVRIALEPLVTLAGATDAGVLGVIHVNKSSSSDVLTLLMGSRAFAAVARSVLFVMVDPEDDKRRLLGQPKNNLGSTDLPTLAFCIVGALVAQTTEGEVWTGKLEWLGESDRSIRDTMEAAAQSAGDRTASSEAADWLHDYLTSQGGTAASEAVIREGAKAGHSRAALHRARHRLHVRSEGRGFPRKTYWLLLPSSHTSLGRLEITETAETTGTTGGGETSIDHTTGIQSFQSSLLFQSSHSPRARETTDDNLPTCLRELAEPDFSDPIGAHDEAAEMAATGREREEL